jgi:hypothetical protein
MCVDVRLSIRLSWRLKPSDIGSPVRDLLQTLTYWLWAFGGSLIVISLIGQRYIREIRGWVGERRVRRVLQQQAYQHLGGFYATDKAGMPTEIDHIVRVPGGLVVIETKNILGAVYGTGSDAKWTVCRGPFRKRIQNPIRQNYRHVATLREIYPDVYIVGLVCFQAGKFPKGRPAGVTDLRSLPDLLAALNNVEKQVEADLAWDDLNVRAERQGRAERIAHRKSLKERFAR